MKVELSKIAFLGILASALETYKRETIGLLFGSKSKKIIRVKLAFPPQTAKRFFARAEITSKAEKRLISIFQNFAHMKLLGFFHSHPEWGDIMGETKLSEDDINSLEVGEIEIVISINKTKRNYEWHYNLDKTLSGTVDHYFFKMACYLKSLKKNSQIKMTPLKIKIKGLKKGIGIRV